MFNEDGFNENTNVSSYQFAARLAERGMLHTFKLGFS